MEAAKIADKTKEIKDNIEKVIVGKPRLVELVVTSLLAGGHVLLEDVPGTGKTMLAKSLAKSLDADFKRVQFTPDLLPSDITGINYFNQKEGAFVFREGPVFSNIVLGDEINRATPRTQAALLECMEEKQVTIDGQTREMSKLFFVIATQNPIETVGTFPLPEAQLDRFMMKLSVGMPEEKEELKMMSRFMSENPLDTLASVCSEEEMVQMQQEVGKVYVHELVKEYILRIVTQTRRQQNVLVGVSPRGSLSLMRAAQAHALVMGRDYILPDDVKLLAGPVLEHRLVMVASYDENNLDAAVINKIVENTEVPVEDFSIR